MLRRNQTGVRSGGGGGGNIDEKRVLDNPGIGRNESGGSRSILRGAQVMSRQGVVATVEHLSGRSLQSQGNKVQRLRAVQTSISFITLTGRRVISGDEALTSGGTLAARLSRSTGRGRAVGVTSVADINLALLELLRLFSGPVREAALAVFVGDSREITSALRSRGRSSDGSSDSERGSGLRSTDEDPVGDRISPASADGIITDRLAKASTSVDIHIEVAVRSIVVDDNIGIGSSEDSNITRTSGSRQSDDHTRSEGTSGTRSHDLPGNRSGISAGRDLLVEVGTRDVVLLTNRGRVLEHGLTETNGHGTVNGVSSRGVGNMPGRDLEVRGTSSILARNEVEVSSHVSGIEDTLDGRTSTSVVSLVVRISPTQAVDPSSDVTAREDSARIGKNTSINSGTLSSDATASVETSGFREVETNDETSRDPREITVGVLSILLNSSQRQLLVPDLNSVDETTEATSSRSKGTSSRRVTGIVVVTNGGMKNEGRSNTIVVKGLLHSIDEDLNNGSGSLVVDVDGNVGPVLVDIDGTSRDELLSTNTDSDLGGRSSLVDKEELDIISS